MDLGQESGKRHVAHKACVPVEHDRVVGPPTLRDELLRCPVECGRAVLGRVDDADGGERENRESAAERGNAWEPRHERRKRERGEGSYAEEVAHGEERSSC